MSRKNRNKGLNATKGDSENTSTIQVKVNDQKGDAVSGKSPTNEQRKPNWIQQEERRVRNKEQTIEEVVKILKDDNNALGARILSLVNHDKKNPGVAIFLGNAKSKALRNRAERIVRDSNGKVVNEWTVDAQTFESISAAALVKWVGIYDRATKEISEISEFIPGITRGAQFSEEKKRNKDQAQEISTKIREKLTEVANLTMNLQKLGFGQVQNVPAKPKPKNVQDTVKSTVAVEAKEEAPKKLNERAPKKGKNGTEAVKEDVKGIEEAVVA